MKYFFAGIRGEGMLELAILLSDLGYEIMCYEDEEYSCRKLEERNITVYNNILDLNEDCIVVYSDLPSDHRVFLKAKELKLKVYNYDDMIEKLVRKFNTICVSGCHGKTFISNMLSYVLESNYIIDGKSLANKESNDFIFEEDKLSRNYDPEYIIISSMEKESKDYETVDEMINEYQEYASKANKMVIACGDDPYTHTISINKPMFYYGINDENDITARDIEYSENGTVFDVYVEDEFYGHFDLPIYGKTMLLDTLAVFSICHYERIEAKDVSKKLKEYNMLNIEKVNSNVIIRDNAKDLIEFKALVKSLKQKYPSNDLYVLNSKKFNIEDVKEIQKKDIQKIENSVIIEIEG